MLLCVQGPCSQNQLALAHSRLWDAVGGFLYIFAHMQDKLSKVSHSSRKQNKNSNPLCINADRISAELEMQSNNIPVKVGYLGRPG